MPRLADARTLIEELCSTGSQIVAQGLTQASGGNLSARLTGAEAFVITASGTWLDSLNAEDFSLVSLDGEVLDGNPAPSSEWKLHHRTYLARPDANAIVHAHPQHAVLVDALGHPVRLMTLDHAVYVRSVGTVPFYHNGSDQLAEAAARSAQDHDCVILSHHGCSAIGEDIAMAYRRAINLEEAATATYRALLLGDNETAFPQKELGELHHA